MSVCWLPWVTETLPEGLSSRNPARIVTRCPGRPWWKVTLGMAAYTLPKSATTAPEDSFVNDAGWTGSYTIRVRTDIRWVHGAAGCGPMTAAGAHAAAATYPGRSQPSGSAG